ncbi:flagella basal body P-ring formation protein FlgA [Desulfocapsa sulfexigens DSM 10523]|uniref:Flagella basal body P-ring formation protein FlgA n=1 Tax=Desulfocapsa sulfexigens (strain DSM 10523 / SB164P1) TaxID=1167006 RepID=M1P827_DESSD|nr:flagellar basal body P-ring formation chaperone FlgA [Desulfocapsa sulfexigens]AGF79628.1 flagella basal body P-ring formation protein FlgA [Desulfocapsa sulfexigens DSM 10523]
MKRVTLLISAFLCLLPGVTLALEITFSPLAEIRSSYITLGDVAEFNEDSALAMALGSKEIAPAPKAGESVTLNSEEVRSTLVANFPVPTDLTWKGANTIVVERKGIIIGPDEIAAKIAEYLEERGDDLPVAEYSFISRELPLPFIIPEGELEVDVIPADPSVIGSRRFSLVYKVDGRTVKNISIRGNLEALASVAILTQNVKRGAILHPDMVELQTKDLSQLRDPCTDLREVLGKKLTRSLRSGTVLDISSIDIPPVIQKGQLVKILINHNGMHLSATGISSMNGKQDQIIRVMNSSSHKMIFCKVIAPGLVEVHI